MTQVSPDMVEVAARAICVEAGDDPDRLTYPHEKKCTGHEREPKHHWQYWRKQAEAALTAALGDTYVIVPRRFSDRMLDAALADWGKRRNGQTFGDIWTAMIAAAPTPEQQI